MPAKRKDAEEILRMIHDGRTNKEIVAATGAGTRTVVKMRAGTDVACRMGPSAKTRRLTDQQRDLLGEYVAALLARGPLRSRCGSIGRLVVEKGIDPDDAESMCFDAAVESMPRFRLPADTRNSEVAFIGFALPRMRGKFVDALRAKSQSPESLPLFEDAA